MQLFQARSAHRWASSSRMWLRVRGMKMKPAMAARPVATTMEIQDIWPLDTVSHVLFLLPVCGGRGAVGGEARVAQH